MKIQINKYMNNHELMSCLPENVFIDMLTSDSPYYEITPSVLEAAEVEYKKRQEGNRIINMVATLNNKGIQLEKKGRIEEAIYTYEENIKSQHPATHAYERLMILYRKKKDFVNEARVIELAIKVFSEANNKAARQAKRKNPGLAKQIEEGLKANTNVIGPDGHFYCFVPYNINKYVLRFEKVKALLFK